MYSALSQYEIKINAFIISDDQDNRYSYAVPVFKLSDIEYKGELVIVAVGEPLRNIVEKNIIQRDQKLCLL